MAAFLELVRPENRHHENALGYFLSRWSHRHMDVPRLGGVVSGADVLLEFFPVILRVTVSEDHAEGHQ